MYCSSSWRTSRRAVWNLWVISAKRERESLVLAKIELRSGFSRESIGEKRRSDWEDGGRCGVIEKDF